MINKKAATKFIEEEIETSFECSDTPRPHAKVKEAVIDGLLQLMKPHPTVKISQLAIGGGSQNVLFFEREIVNEETDFVYGTILVEADVTAKTTIRKAE